MLRSILWLCLVTCALLLAADGIAIAQRASSDSDTAFGPVMRAYLGYLNNEQEVVDDRISRREISAAYYRRNSNRIRALRQTAIKLVHQSGNDFVPELEAVAGDELRTLFERPPNPATFRTTEIVANKLRFLGSVHSGEVFYVFARLDPFEQAELMQRHKLETQGPQTAEDFSGVAKGQTVGQRATRPRRIPR